jgi:hypothetical protein
MLTFSNAWNVSSVLALKETECSVLNSILESKFRKEYPQSFSFTGGEEESQGDEGSSLRFFSTNLGLFVLIGAACGFIFGVYSVYQWKYGVSHQDAQRFLALQFSDDSATGDDEEHQGNSFCFGDIYS